MDNMMYACNVPLVVLKEKYPDDEFVIMNEGVEGDTTYGTWYVTLEELNPEFVKTAWKQDAEEW